MFKKQKLLLKVIIAGCRHYAERCYVAEAMEAWREAYPNRRITEVVWGCAAGIDSLGAEWATEQRIQLKAFPADWNRYGRAAGPIRNERMAEYADALVAIWDGRSKGTYNMIQEANRHGLLVFVYYPEETQ